MAFYPCTRPGVEALRKLASDLTMEGEQFATECTQLSGRISGLSEGLQQYGVQIQDVISGISSTITTVNDGVQRVSSSLNGVASKYEGILNKLGK